LTTEEQWTASV